MPDFSIGVDLGGTNLRIAAVTTDGELLEKITLASKGSPGRDAVIDQMCDAIQKLAGKYKSHGAFLGAGIGVPGIVDVQNGIMRRSANLPGFEDYPVRAEIERRLRAGGLLKNDARIVLDNDAKVAALGEQWLGAARGVPNVAVITLGTGIGGGIILNGKIWYGLNGMAGEFGHVTVEPEGAICGCGNRGCAERYASASALLRMVREAIDAGEAPALAQAASSGVGFGAHSVYNLAMQGDQPARNIFLTFGRYLGIMLAGAINVLNLDMYVIGGGVAAAWDAFAPKMFEELRERSTIYAATVPVDSINTGSDCKEEAAESANSGIERSSGIERRTVITRALLGSDAGLYGAARAAIPAR